MGVVLTTYMQGHGEWIEYCDYMRARPGSMWGYQTAYRRQAWSAQAMAVTVMEAHTRTQSLQRTQWILSIRQLQDPKYIYE